MQLERLTGGFVLAGFHEVIVCKETLEAMERQKYAFRQNPVVSYIFLEFFDSAEYYSMSIYMCVRAIGRPLWRVSSTVFVHLASRAIVQPLKQFATPEARTRYPPGEAGAQVCLC